MSPPRTATARREPARSSTTTRGGKRRRARTGAHAPRRPARAAAAGSRAAAQRTPATKHRAPAHRRTHRARTRSASRLGRLPFLVASFVLVGVLVVGVASLQAVVSQGSFRMQDLSRRNVELREEYGRLKLEVAELSAPGRIAVRARRLGLRLPQPGEVSTLKVKGAARANPATGISSAPAVSLRSLLEREP